MNRVVKILMERDGISELEAETRLDAYREELDGVDDYGEAEEIIQDHLGLEMDYLVDIL